MHKRLELLIYITDNQMGTNKKNRSTPIPGLIFSWKRALGITQIRQRIARETGVPTSKAGAERKIGNIILKALFKKR
jgi:hypothetical protein